MDIFRLIFWVLACLILVPFVIFAWFALFWLNPDETELDESDLEFMEDFDEEEPTIPRRAVA